MLNDEFFSNFLKKCLIETSLFNPRHAMDDPDWIKISKIFDNAKIKQDAVENPIPKIVHFIWLGNDIPKFYEGNIEDWKSKNPSFEFKLWGNEDSEAFMKSKSSYSNFSNAKSFGIKSDILRYEILLEMGGLYVDTDFLCTCSEKFKYLHDSWSFYAGICLERPVQLNNGIMASSPNHPIVKMCVEEVSKPDLEKGYSSISCDQSRVLFQTGPWLLTRSMLKYLNGDAFRDDILIMPSQTFHPFPAFYRNEVSLEIINKYLKHHSMACHLWHSSWQPNTKFYMGETL